MTGRFDGRDRRAQVRTEYPPHARPVLEVRGRRFEVVDISSHGLRFGHGDGVNLAGWINGTVRFADRDAIDIDGIVVRHHNGELGVHLVTPIAI